MASSNKIERAHQMYREGRYEEGLGFYTEALSMAKTNPQRIALHSNRAACYLKLHYFIKAVEECTSVLELDQNHTGALMLRAQTLVTLKEYRSALFDVNRLIELNPLSDVYQNLEARLRTQLSLASIPESEAELEGEEAEEEEDEQEVEEQEDEKENDDKENLSEAKEVETTISTISEVLSFKIPIKKVTTSEPENGQTVNSAKSKPIAEVVAPQAPNAKGIPENDPKGWQSIPKPKGHAALDYARWDRVEDGSSEDDDDDDDEDNTPQYRFRLKNVGVRQVK